MIKTINTSLIGLLLTCAACSKDSSSETGTSNVTTSTNTGSIQIFPTNNTWNTDISGEPVDPNSDKLIASIGNNTCLHPDFGTTWEGSPIGIPYNVVEGTQTKVKVTFGNTKESDAGPYPIPPAALIEAGSDKHVLVLDKNNLKLYELYDAVKNTDNSWNAVSGAIYNLTSNVLRTDYWTSADAAGLPIFPGLVRYDEVIEKGEIRHALRFTVNNTRNAFVHPAIVVPNKRTISLDFHT